MPPNDALRLAMEQSLAANFDDLATHHAYADLLTEQGDPRGEFIQVQLALEDELRLPAERQHLERRQEELLSGHQSEWLGEAADLFLTPDVGRLSQRFGLSFGYGPFDFFLARGWLTALYLNEFSPTIARMLERSATIRLLRRLTIRKGLRNNPAFALLAEWPALDGLRSLQLGTEDGHCSIWAEGIDLVVAGTRRLEELRLYAANTPTRQVFALPMPHLRRLDVHHAYEYPLDVLGQNATLGNLTRLSCWPHALEPDDEQAYVQAEPFRAMCHSPHLKSLTHLAVYLSDVGDEGVRAVVESGLLKRLRVLDLWSGRITDEGARLLASSPDICHLERLRLSRNNLTPAGIHLLQATGVHLEAHDQLNAVGVEDRLHLTDGDIE